MMEDQDIYIEVVHTYMVLSSYSYPLFVATRRYLEPSQIGDTSGDLATCHSAPSSAAAPVTHTRRGDVDVDGLGLCIWL